MAQHVQIVKFSQKEVQDILVEKAKEVVGKTPQGAVEARFFTTKEGEGEVLHANCAAEVHFNGVTPPKNPTKQS